MKRPLGVVIPALACVGAIMPAHAQPALVNGGFDIDLAGWNLPSGNPSVSAAWVNDDHVGGVGSGSAELRDVAFGLGGTQTLLSQCVDLGGTSQSVSFGASAWVDKEGEPVVVAYLTLEQHSDDICSSYIGLAETRLVNDSQPGWTTVSGQFVPFDSSVQSVRVMLGVEKPPGSGGGGVARFDAVRFGGTAPPIRLRRWSIDAGGGRGASPARVITASIGQPDAGSAASADYQLQSGFWFGPASPPTVGGDAVFADGFESP